MLYSRTGNVNTPWHSVGIVDISAVLQWWWDGLGTLIAQKRKMRHLNDQKVVSKLRQKEQCATSSVFYVVRTGLGYVPASVSQKTSIKAVQTSWSAALPDGSVSIAGSLLRPVCWGGSMPHCTALQGRAMRLSSGATIHASRMIFMHCSLRTANITA